MSKILTTYKHDPNHEMKEYLHRKLDWGSWEYGWHGSDVIVGIYGNHVYLRTYNKITMTDKNVLSKKIYRYTIKQFWGKFGKFNDDYRMTDEIIDINICKLKD